MHWYWYYVILVLIVYFTYWIFETKIFNFFGLQKNVIYNGVKNDTLTGKAQGVRNIIAGILFFSFSIPALLIYKHSLWDTILIRVFFAAVWPISFVALYWGCVILLRPHVFGEDSRCDIPCDEYAKDCLLNESIPLSYTELVNRSIPSFIFGSVFPFYLGIYNDYGNFSLWPRIIIVGSLVVILLLFTFMDKINEHWSYDIRYQPGYSDYMLCAYFLPFIPDFVALLLVFLNSWGLF